MDSDAPRKHNDNPIDQQNAAPKENAKIDSGGPKPPEVVPSPQNPNGSNNRAHNSPIGWFRILEGVGIVAVIIYTAVTWCMWRDSHNNFITDQRAWLNVDSRAMDIGTIKANVPISGRTLFSNTGKTAAKQILSEFQIEFHYNAQAPSLRYDKSSIKTLIGYMVPRPTSDPVSLNVWQGDQTPTETLTDTQAKDLIEGKAYLTVFGHGQYIDIFGNEHWFHYCGHVSYLQTPNGPNALSCIEYTDAGDGPLPEGRLTKR